MSDDASPTPREHSRLDNSHLLDGSDRGALAPLAETHSRSDGRMTTRAEGRKDNHAESDSDDSIIGTHRRREPQPVPEVRVRKKPGPKPSGKSQLMKNDMQAKRAVIKEIEGFWGKNFIKRYVPQPHRPLVKRPAGTTRNIPRFPENLPQRWKPSVLKAMRSLAEKSQDRTLLRKLMSEVVKYRNKHTGNKKPEMVTTDFDVIEDVLDRSWTVPQSFGIRYKHLLAGGKSYRGDLDGDSDSESESDVPLEGGDEYDAGIQKEADSDEDEFFRKGKAKYRREPESENEDEQPPPKKQARSTAPEPRRSKPSALPEYPQHQQYPPYGQDLRFAPDPRYSQNPHPYYTPTGAGYYFGYPPPPHQSGHSQNPLTPSASSFGDPDDVPLRHLTRGSESFQPRSSYNPPYPGHGLAHHGRAPQYSSYPGSTPLVDPRQTRIKESPSSHHAQSPLVKQEASIKPEPGVEAQDRDRGYTRDPSVIMGASFPHHREVLRVSTPPTGMMPPEIDTSEFINADDEELAARIEQEERALKLQAMKQEMAKRNKNNAAKDNA